MTDIAGTVAAFRRVIDLLAQIDDLGATQTAAALSRWLAGETFDQAADLVPGWRSHVRLAARDRALAELVKVHTSMADLDLAIWILDGLERVGRPEIRPDAADGHLFDLARAGRVPGRRHLRPLIAAARGHRADGMATELLAALAKPKDGDQC
jgi:hypothetical protein